MDTRKAHVEAYKRADPRAIHIEETLQKKGLSGLMDGMKPKATRAVINISSLYAAYGLEPPQSRVPLGAYILQLGNQIVDWIVESLHVLVERGDKIADAFSAKMILFMIRVQRDIAVLPQAKAMRNALVRSDLRLLLRTITVQRGCAARPVVTRESAQAVLDSLCPLMGRLAPKREQAVLMGPGA